jgi:hypothetical protein
MPDVNLNTSMSVSVTPSLWTGRTTGWGDHHSDQPLIRGVLKFRPPRGCCEVRGAGPNLWFAAAGALGFRVTTVRCAFTPFVDLIGAFCGGPKSLPPCPRQCNSLPDVVFLDLGALPWGPGAKKYWERWRTPHVFFCQGADDNTVGTRAGPPSPSCPPEWALRSVTLSHCEAGGPTSGRWTVVVWYPPLLSLLEPLLAAPQAWFPLFCYIRDRESAVHHPTPPSGSIAVPYVV